MRFSEKLFRRNWSDFIFHWIDWEKQSALLEYSIPRWHLQGWIVSNSGWKRIQRFVFFQIGMLIPMLLFMTYISIMRRYPISKINIDYTFWETHLYRSSFLLSFLSLFVSLDSTFSLFFLLDFTLKFTLCSYEQITR